MKLFILSLTVLISTGAMAKNANVAFSAALLDDVKQDVSKDDETFKKPGSRAPASVEPTGVSLEEQKQNDKIQKNLNQMGKPTW